MALKGSIGRIKNMKVVGWAFDPTNVTRAVKLQVYINDQLYKVIHAKESRPHMVSNDLHPTGQCGFEVDLGEFDFEMGELYRIEIRSPETKGKLHNSPAFLDKRQHSQRVLVVGLNKSGTSILTYRIAGGMGANHVYFEPRSNKGLSDYRPHVKFTARDKVVTKCLYHHGKSNLLSSIGQLYNKKVWIVRDPRDVIISSFLYMWYSGHKKPRDKFDHAYKKVLAKEKAPGTVSFLDTIQGTINVEKYLEERIAPVVNKINNLDPDWFILKYEDLMENNDTALNTYLGFEIDRDTEVMDRVKRVSRSKSYDNWRKWFTPEDVKTLKPLFKEFLSKSGYDAEDWNIDTNPVLDPDTGSNYMYNLYFG